jgi:hypothetical protein
MKVSDYVWTQKYMHQYGNAVVVAIKKRIRQDNLIDTGDLLNSINYDLKMTSNSFQVIFKMGDGNFKYGSGLPSEYGVYQDQGTIYIEPHYFFTAPIPGLTKKVFSAKLKLAMKKDIAKVMKQQLKGK